jgi:hypothetical protein
MRSHKVIGITAILTNFIGTVLLYYAFSLAPMDLRVVSSPKGGYAICTHTRAALVVLPSGGFGFGADCPETEDTNQAVTLRTNHPGYARIGIALIVFSALFGFGALIVESESKCHRPATVPPCV